MSDETIAAVIPTKDRPNRVQNAVESVLNQTYSNMEIIIIDDSTGHETAARIENLSTSTSEKELTYISNPRPRGVSAARNQAISKTDAKYIAFLDDDDVWKPTKTKKQLYSFHKGSEFLAAVYCGFKSVTDTGKHLHTKVPQYGGNIYDELLVKDIVGPPSTVMIRRKIIEEVGGFNKNYDHHEDWELYLRIAENYRFGISAEPLTIRTIHDDATSKDIEAALEHRKQILSRNEATLRNKGLYDAAWGAHYQKSGVMTCRHGNIEQGRRFFRSSLYCRLHYRTLLLFISTLFGKYGFQLLRDLKRIVNTTSVE